MAITVTQRGAINTDVDDATVQVSATLTIGLVYVAFIWTSFLVTDAPTVTSIAGTGLSMTKRTTTGSAENAIDDGGGTLYRVECWYGKCTASGTVTVTATLSVASLNSDFMLYEIGGGKVTGTNGADAIVQAVCLTHTSGDETDATTVTLASFASASNRPLGFKVHALRSPTDPGSGFTELLNANHNNSAGGTHVQWCSDSADTTVDWTWGDFVVNGAIAVELAIAPASGTGQLSGEGSLTNSALLGGLAR